MDPHQQVFRRRVTHDHRQARRRTWPFLDGRGDRLEALAELDPREQAAVQAVANLGYRRQAADDHQLLVAVVIEVGDLVVRDRR